MDSSPITSSQKALPEFHIHPGTGTMTALHQLRPLVLQRTAAYRSSSLRERRGEGYGSAAFSRGVREPLHPLCTPSGVGVPRGALTGSRDSWSLPILTPIPRKWVKVSCDNKRSPHPKWASPSGRHLRVCEMLYQDGSSPLLKTLLALAFPAHPGSPPADQCSLGSAGLQPPFNERVTG